MVMIYYTNYDRPELNATYSVPSFTEMVHQFQRIFFKDLLFIALAAIMVKRPGPFIQTFVPPPLKNDTYEVWL